MKTFTIDVHPYPQEFVISANSEEEAKQIARERFSQATNGSSVYETVVTNTEDIE